MAYRHRKATPRAQYWQLAAGVHVLILTLSGDANTDLIAYFLLSVFHLYYLLTLSDLAHISCKYLFRDDFLSWVSGGLRTAVGVCVCVCVPSDHVLAK